MAFSNHYKKALTERYEKMYFSTKDRLISFVQRNVQDRVVADDIVQECYIRLWENMDKVRDDATILNLLHKYAHNLIIDHIRKTARDVSWKHQYMQQQATSCVTDDQLLLKETLLKHKNLINSLPPKCRTIYHLVKEEGLSHHEISTRLNVSKNTIERHMNKALSALRINFPSDKLSALLLIIAAINQ